MRQLLREHLFLLAGVLSLSLFFVAAGLDGAGESDMARTLAGPMRVLIVPMYLVWMLISIVQVALAGPRGLPQPLGALVSVFSMVAGLAPYALLDYILACVSRARSRR